MAAGRTTRLTPDPEHLRRLKAGRDEWNAWRSASRVRPDLRGVKLMRRDLSGYDLSGARLEGAILVETTLRRTNLARANLARAVARFGLLSRANLAGAILRGTDLRGASLRRADLTGADLRGAVLRFTSMVETIVDGADLRGAEIYGVSAWNLRGEPKAQSDLVIRVNAKAIPTTVDDLDTAQFVSLLLDNPKIADVIDAASRRVVLLLGRFARRYKAVLDAIKAHLLARNYVPVLFDFDRPRGRDLTETVASLAHMAYFVVADLSGARSIPQELSYVVPYLPSVPVVPLLAAGGREYAMFEHFRRYPWVHAPVRYRDVRHLLSIFDEQVLAVGRREAAGGR